MYWAPDGGCENFYKTTTTTTTTTINYQDSTSNTISSTTKKTKTTLGSRIFSDEIGTDVLEFSKVTRPTPEAFIPFSPQITTVPNTTVPKGVFQDYSGAFVKMFKMLSEQHFLTCSSIVGLHLSNYETFI